MKDTEAGQSLKCVLEINDADKLLLNEYPELWARVGPISQCMNQENLDRLAMSPHLFPEQVEWKGRRWQTYSRMVYDEDERRFAGTLMIMAASLYPYAKKKAVDNNLLQKRDGNPVYGKMHQWFPEDVKERLRASLMETTNVYLRQWFAPLTQRFVELYAPDHQRTADIDHDLTVKIHDFYGGSLFRSTEENWEKAKMALFLDHVKGVTGHDLRYCTDRTYRSVPRPKQEPVLPLQQALALA